MKALRDHVKRRMRAHLERRGWRPPRPTGGSEWHRRLHEEIGTQDFPREWTHTVDQTRPYTLCSAERMGGLVAAVEHVVKNEVPGAFVECGVWRGGSSMAVALTLRRLNDIRDLYLFDTFEGMPPAGEVDVTVFGETMEQYDGIEANRARSVQSRTTVEDVRKAMAGTGYPQDRVHLVKGMVEDTIPASAPHGIAVLRLDTDWYESTRHELEHLYPRVAQGGVVIIDDYGYFEGAKRATDEYLGDKVFLHRLDFTGRLLVKP